MGTDSGSTLTGKRGKSAEEVDAEVRSRLMRVREVAAQRQLRVAAFKPPQAVIGASSGEAKPGGDKAPETVTRISPLAAPDRVNAAVQDIQIELMKRIDPAVASRMDREALTNMIAEPVSAITRDFGLSFNQMEMAALSRRLMDELVGFGPLEPLLADESVNDILVNGPKRVYVERFGRLELSDITFTDAAHVMHVATRIVTRIGRRIDETTPLVDARLPDGSRVNVIVPPLAVDWPMISIRKFSKQEITLEKMLALGSMSSPMAALLMIAVRSRLNILVSGGTGSGKTTLLNALSRMIDNRERIITIEDAAELQLQQPHVGRLETRAPNLEGEGEITIRDLFRNALRMRPDRIIVGEIRGMEAFDMLQAMNSGHDGSLGTIHASGAREALVRLENIVGMSGLTIPPRALRAQVASSIHLVIQTARMRDGKRRITHVIEVVGVEGEVFTTQDLFTYHVDSETAQGELNGRYVGSGLRPAFFPRADSHGLGTELLKAMSIEG